MTRLGRDLAPMDCSEADLGLLATGSQQLQQRFLLVVVGEFNSGKSQFVNALLGSPYCKVGVLPTTEHVHILRYGEKEQLVEESDNVRLLALPVPWLKETNVVDTPGTNAVLQEHQEITEHFVPRSDLVLFVTSVERPFSESERLFLQRIRQWKKKVVLVLNKSDTLPIGQLEDVLAFVKTNAKEVLHEEPEIFALSSKQAVEAKVAIRQLRKGYVGAKDTEKDALLAAETALQEQLKKSGFQALEEYITGSLGSMDKIALKINNPLGISENLLEKYSKALKSRKSLLQTDISALTTVEQELMQFKTDMQNDLALQITKLDAIFQNMTLKTDDFLNDNLRLGNIVELLRSDKLKQKYQAEVTSGITNEIEDCIRALIDWIVEKTQRQAQAVSSFLALREKAFSEHHGGALPTNRGLPTDFTTQRRALMQTLSTQARQVYTDKDREEAMTLLASEVRTSLMATVAVEAAGAVGLGALSSAALLDWSGVAGASLVAVSGLYVFPLRRSLLKKEMKGKISDMKLTLNKTVRRHFDRELELALEAIDNNLSPYSRFARVEKGKLDNVEADFKWASQEMKDIKVDLHGLMADRK